MTSIVPHIPGLFRDIRSPSPGTAIAGTGTFAGMLEPVERAYEANTAVAQSADSFDEHGMFGRTAAVTGAPQPIFNALDVVTGLARHASEPGQNNALVAADRKSASTQSMQAVKLPESARYGGWHPGEQDAAPSQQAEISAISPIFRDTRRADTGGANRSSDRGFAPVPARPSAAPKQASVLNFAFNAGDNMASLLIRGDIALPELRSRLRATLADYNLTLASLHVNGFEQPGLTRPIRREKHGDQR